MTSLKQTPFHPFHLEAGAKMVDFGGWDMPLLYDRIIPEHHAVRQSVGLFDVSHMGEVFIRGSKAQEVVRYLMTNSIDLQDGQAQYTCMCNHQGGIVDDVIVYRMSEKEFLVCVNAANRKKDFDWMVANNPLADEVTITNESDRWAQVAIQGRHSANILQKLTALPLENLSYYHQQYTTVAGIDGCLIARTGYTGEDGFEVFLPTSGASEMWGALFQAGQEFALRPIGLGARDTLRLEARMHLYGSDMNDQTTPYEAALGWAVDLQKANFVGKAALLEHKQKHWKKRLVGMTVEKRIPRPGTTVRFDGQDVGEITSGTKSPSLGYGIALGYVPRRLARVGTVLELAIRSKTAVATVVKGAFYKRDY